MTTSADAIRRPPKKRGSAVLDDRISLQKLETLCLIVELGSVALAAERLGESDSIVSARFRQLEARLNVGILVQRGRRFELTEEGKHVYRWASETLIRGRAMIRDVVDLDGTFAGSVRVGAGISLGSYLLPDVFLELKRQHPEADLSLTVGDAADVLRGVNRAEFDFGLGYFRMSPASGLLTAELLGEEEIVLVTSLDGTPHVDEIEVGALAKLSIICPPANTERRRLLDDLLAGYGVTLPATGLDLGHPESAKRVVREGSGATLLSRCSVEKELSAGLMREVKISDARLCLSIYAVHRTDTKFTALQSTLLEMVKERLRARGRTNEPN